MMVAIATSRLKREAQLLHPPEHVRHRARSGKLGC